MLDGPGQRPGQKAATLKGSLAGMPIARWGTEEPALGEGEWEKLNDWFKVDGKAYLGRAPIMGGLVWRRRKATQKVLL